MITDLTRVALQYFSAFSDKNLVLLNEMYSDSIALLDWDIQVYGRDSVIGENKKLFDSVHSISIEPLLIAQRDNTVISEISVHINKNSLINVVDVLVFDNYGLIDKITAYKR
jgi:hypothetical protein